MPRRIAVLAAALVVATAACGSSGPAATPSINPLATAKLPTKSHPYTVTIDLKKGQKVTGPNVQVPLTVYGLQVVDKIGDANKKGEGHIVYYLDVDLVPMAPGHSALATSGEGKSFATADTGHIWKDVPVGAHKLDVQLVNNDNTPLEPPATDEVHVTVVKQTPAPSSTATASG